MNDGMGCYLQVNSKCLNLKKSEDSLNLHVHQAYIDPICLQVRKTISKRQVLKPQTLSEWVTIMAALCIIQPMHSLKTVKQPLLQR